MIHLWVFGSMPCSTSYTLSLNLHSRLHSFIALSWDVQYLIWKERKKDWKTRLTSFDLFLFASNDLKLSFRSSAFLSPKEKKSDVEKRCWTEPHERQSQHEKINVVSLCKKRKNLIFDGLSIREANEEWCGWIFGESRELPQLSGSFPHLSQEKIWI